MGTFADKPITNDEIKKLLTQNHSCKEICEAFAVSQQRVAALKGALKRSAQK